MHDSAFRFAKKHIMGKRFRGVVEFGSRNVNGAIRPHVSWMNFYVGVDIKPGMDVDVVQDAAKYRHNEPVGLVICMETLEHASNWKEIVANAAMLLAVGGQFIMTCAGPNRMPHSAVDGGQLRPGEYYQNVSPEDFEAVANENGLHAIEIQYRPELGDLYYIGQKQ